MANIYIEQAKLKYKNGLYSLGDYDKHGQRVNIEIELHGIGSAKGKTSYIKSGWMERDNGLITLATPAAGFTRSKEERK
ncbi:MAG TPA: hypothetical protein DEP42_00870 [Ruminococcaceae bacterium]|nr:hypothetical protein [Oscillospiraceae bacterium]